MNEEMRDVVKELKRAAGFLVSRFRDLKFELVQDKRRAAGKRWKLPAILKTAIVGIMAGCKSVAEVEALTSNMPRHVRQALGISRRLPDSTLREILLRLEPDDIRALLHSLVHAAGVRKALAVQGFPFHVVSLDGKATAIPNWDNEYSQRVTYDDKRQAHGMVRLVNACLISTRARPVIDSVRVHASTNEMGAFPEVFASLLKNYGRLFTLVTYDAGVPSQENCQLVVDAGKHFNFRIKNENWLVYQEAQRLLGSMTLKQAKAGTETVRQKDYSVIRRVFTCKAPELPFIWSSIKTLMRVQVQHVREGKVVAEENKYYISSLVQDALSPKQWLRLSRGHWRIENNVHWLLDKVFSEDDKPWILTEPKATVVVMLLRRIACSMLAIFRAVSLPENVRALPWADMVDWIYRTLMAVSEADLMSLRSRPKAIAVS